MVDEVLEEIENGYLMDQPDTCPDGMYDIMCKCWEMEPPDRPSFQTLQLLLQQSFSHGMWLDPLQVSQTTRKEEVPVLLVFLVRVLLNPLPPSRSCVATSYVTSF